MRPEKWELDIWHHITGHADLLLSGGVSMCEAQQSMGFKIRIHGCK